MIDIDVLNTTDDSQLRSELMRCSGCKAWTQAMLAMRPFSSPEKLIDKARKIWWDLEKEDWLEGFASHPRIGDISNLKEKYHSTAEWAQKEQGSVADAASQVLRELAEKNATYKRRFGFIFIVCASGKSAEEMLSILNGRLENVPETELRIAAEEHLKITELRLHMAFAYPTSDVE